MQVLELHFNPKARKDKIFDSFCYEPENVYEKRLGSLYIIGQVSRLSGRHVSFLDNLSSSIKTKYYGLSSRSPAASLKQGLKAGNSFLADLIKKGNVDWLGNFNFAVLALKKSVRAKKTCFTLNFTKVGKIKIFLARQGQILEIGKELEAQDIDPYPPKFFFNTASGKLEEDDRLIVVTRDLFQENEDLIQQLGRSQTLDEKTLKEIFKKNKKEPKNLSGICFLTNLIKESVNPMALTFRQEAEKYFWLKRIWQASKTFFGKIPLPRISLPKMPLPRTVLAKIKIPKIKLTKIRLNRKFALIPVLAVFLLLGFLIFSREKDKALQLNQGTLQQVEAKTIQAQSFLLLKETQKANLLFQEALNEVGLLASAGAPLQEKAQQLQESIEKELAQINKIEEIEDLEIFPDISPYISVFGFSQNNFAIYLLDANTGQIIKYPYSLTSGRGESEFWLKEKAPEISGAKSITVDGSVWVLDKDNQILRFYQGTYQETIEINVWPALENPTRIWTSDEHQEVYVLEPSQNRIIVLGKNGEILKQLTLIQP